MKKLLVLDVEGTLITGYDYLNELSDGSFPAIIDPQIRVLLENLQTAGFYIVLATGTDGVNLDYYRSQFALAGFLNSISSFSPDEHSPNDSKEDKLLKYAAQYDTALDDIYYFDDGKGNVERTISKGVKNSFQVTEQEPLVVHLHKLLKQAPTPIVNQSTNALVPKNMLVIDIEGTFVTDYDLDAPLPNGRFATIIAPALNAILSELHTLGFIIVLAPRTDGDSLDYYKKELDYYKSEFDKAGLLQYITAFWPENFSINDFKSDMVQKYSRQYNIPLSNIYYYDDAQGNVDNARASSITNSFQVTAENPLTKQLMQLIELVSADKQQSSLARINYQALLNTKTVDLGREVILQIIDWILDETNEFNDARMHNEPQLKALASRIKVQDKPEQMEQLIREVLTIINPDTTNTAGQSLLHYAAHENKVNVVRYLFNNPIVQINRKSNNGGFTPLHFACAAGNTEIVRVFLENPNTNFNLVDSSGTTPLMRAVSKGASDIVTMFTTKRGININHQEVKGCSALIFAAERGDEQSVAMILAVPGINCDLQSKDSKFTALISAVVMKHPRIVRLLIDKKANLTLETDDKSTALDLATNTEIRSQLIQAHRTQGTLLYATFRGLNKAIPTTFDPLLLSASVSSQNILSLELIKEVLHNSTIDVNSRNESGYTLLMCAVLACNASAVQLLLSDNRVNAFAYNLGSTARGLANRLGYNEIISLFDSVYQRPVVSNAQDSFFTKLVDENANANTEPNNHASCVIV